MLCLYAFTRVGDFIAYLLKKFPPDTAHPERAHASAPRKRRRPTGVSYSSRPNSALNRKVYSMA